MGFVPDKPSDAFWFAVAPITAVPTAIYGAAGYATGEYPLGKPDWAANARNSLLWTGVAGSVYAWNYFMSPQNAVWMSGMDAFKTVGHVWGSRLLTASATAAIPALVYVGAQQTGPELVEIHEEQVSTLEHIFRTGVYLLFGR